MGCFAKIVNNFYLLTIFAKHSLQTYNVPLILESRKYKTQANERLTKTKEKWSSIRFYVSDLSFSFFILMFHKCHKQKWWCYYLQLLFAGVCVCDCMHQVEKTDLLIWFWLVFLSAPQISVLCPLFVLVYINNLSNYKVPSIRQLVADNIFFFIPHNAKTSTELN